MECYYFVYYDGYDGHGFEQFGTAEKAAEFMLKNRDRKYTVVYGKVCKVTPTEIVKSLRIEK